MKLRVTSIFQSIDGEVNDYGQGALTVFIRLAGCNLKCTYGAEGCDTPNSLKMDSGTFLTNEEIIKEVKKYGIKKVTITGGEPLLQKEPLIDLCVSLKDAGYIISIETNGSLPADDLPGDMNIIMDYKLPSSGMEDKMQFNHFRYLDSHDIIKFVILDGYDFERAVQVMGQIQDLRGKNPIKFAFSPVHGQLSPKLLIKWMQESHVKMGILNLQLHKIIDLSEPK